MGVRLTFTPTKRSCFLSLSQSLWKSHWLLKFLLEFFLHPHLHMYIWAVAFHLSLSPVSSINCAEAKPRVTELSSQGVHSTADCEVSPLSKNLTNPPIHLAKSQLGKCLGCEWSFEFDTWCWAVLEWMSLFLLYALFSSLFPPVCLSLAVC